MVFAIYGKVMATRFFFPFTFYIQRFTFYIQKFYLWVSHPLTI